MLFIPRIIFGFHGCDESIVRMVLEGGALRPSTNAWDWLGHGIYFWEDSPARALLWAQEMSRLPGSAVKNPSVLGAIIDLGHCLNLTDPAGDALVKAAYDEHLRQGHEFGIPAAVNKGAESKARFLDCAVMNLLHELRADLELPAFDTVRGFFIEPKDEIASRRLPRRGSGRKVGMRAA